ncbi:hypothetical protein [Carnobacterium gallinarum]|nr:hypothetical protein [Carnobacterium gallinarum]
MDEESKASYLYDQDLFYTFKQKDFASFEALLHAIPTQVSEELKTIP